MDIMEIDKLKKELAKLQKEIEVGRKERDKVSSDVKKLSIEEVNLLNEISDINKDLEIRRKVSDDMIAKSDELRKELLSLKSECKVANDLLNLTKKEVDLVPKKLVEEQERITAIVKDVEKDKSDNKTKSIELAKSQAEMSRRLSDLNKAIKDCSDKQVELDIAIESFNLRNEKLNNLIKTTDIEKEKAYKAIDEYSKKLAETKLLEQTLKDKIVHIDEIKKINEKLTLTIEEGKTKNAEKEKALLIMEKSFESRAKGLDTAEKQLKIKELRVNEIIRTQGIDKELKALEEKAKR